MDKTVFEKYIKEMREMKAAAKPVVSYQKPQKEATVSPPNSKDMAGIGGLMVNVTSARGLYPVSGASVTVFTGDGDNRKIIAEVITDASGKTPLIPLPAPSVRFSESPDPAERPYAYYNIYTVADGFVENYNYNAAVFDKTTSIQNVNLEPLTTSVEGNRPIIIDGFENYNL